MDKESFKIGDKVKLRHPKQWSMGDSIGKIVGFDEFVRVDWKYRDDSTIWDNYPHLPREIKKVSRKGEQLVFAFMLT